MQKWTPIVPLLFHFNYFHSLFDSTKTNHGLIFVVVSEIKIKNKNNLLLQLFCKYL
jgi:hypothetical protein